MANAAASEALSLPAGEDAGDRWWSGRLTPWEEECMREAFTQVLNEREALRGIVHPLPDGRTFSFEMVPLRGEDGEAHAVAMSLDDITEQQEGRRLSQAINEMQDTIGSTLDFDTIMGRVVELARTSMRASSTSMAMRQGRRWRITHTSGMGPFAGEELSEAEARRTFRSLTTKDIEIVEDVTRVPGLMRAPLVARKARASMLVPLWRRGRIIGLMIFGFEEVARLSSLELDYARKIGDIISVAVENSSVLEGEKKERRLLQQVVESSPAAIALVACPELRPILVNERFRNLLQGEKDLSRAIDAMPEASSTRVRTILDRAHRSGEAYSESELPISLCDGSVLYWNIQVAPLERSVDGNLLIVASDVTSHVEDRKRIEDLVRITDDERARLEAVLETLPVGVLVVDPKGRNVVTNEAFRTFFDFPATLAEVDLLRVEGRWSDTGIALKVEDWPISRALRGERVVGTVIDVRRRDREIRTVMASASPVTGRSGVIGAVLVFSDITEQRHAEQEAVQAKSRMELYLDLLSHDVNNLNAGAKGYLELILQKGQLHGRVLQFAEKADKLLEDISQLVENVRKLQKVEAEWHQRSTVDLSWLIDDVAASHRNTPGREVSIHFRPAERALVNANELLRDVFDNLIGNAVKHAIDPVEVTITLGRAMVGGREYYRVDIEDNGPGIPDEMKPVLFNRMQRGRTTAKGHGLGLYLARTVLDMFDGQVWADDRVPGDHTKGARFVVLLPVAELGPPVKGR